MKPSSPLCLIESYRLSSSASSSRYSTRSFIRIPMDIDRVDRQNRQLLSPENGAGNMTGWLSLTSKRPLIKSIMASC
jgi:hypothetical protein